MSGPPVEEARAAYRAALAESELKRPFATNRSPHYTRQGSFHFVFLCSHGYELYLFQRSFTSTSRLHETCISESRLGTGQLDNRNGLGNRRASDFTYYFIVRCWFRLWCVEYDSIKERYFQFVDPVQIFASPFKPNVGKIGKDNMKVR